MKSLVIVAALLFASPAYAEGKPADCPRLWCGCYMAKYFGFVGDKARELWLARNWLRFPRTTPHVGAVAVLSRGRRGGHVGIVKALDANGNPTLLSGNVRRRVTVTTFPKSRVIAYVNP